MIHNLSEKDSIVSHWLMELRDIKTQKDRMRFRRNIERIGEVIGYEISKTFEYGNFTTTTPISSTTCRSFLPQPVLATILRAGVPFI